MRSRCAVLTLEVMQKAREATDNCGLKVTIISDSAEASHRAKLMAERLVPDLRPELVLLGNVFEVPSNIAISQEERDMILRSDVIIISAHGVDTLPRHIKSWFQDIPDNGMRPFALVALLDPEGTLPRLLTLRGYLREIARDRDSFCVC